MDPNVVKEVVEITMSKVATPVIYLSVVAFIFYVLQGFVKDVILYLAARFDEVGCGVVLYINGERYRVQKIRFGYIQLLDLNTKEVLVRIPLRNWKSMNKFMCFNGKPRRRENDEVVR